MLSFVFIIHCFPLYFIIYVHVLKQYINFACCFYLSLDIEIPSVFLTCLFLLNTVILRTTTLCHVAGFHSLLSLYGVSFYESIRIYWCILLLLNIWVIFNLYYYEQCYYVYYTTHLLTHTSNNLSSVKVEFLRLAEFRSSYSFTFAPTLNTIILLHIC